MRRSVSNGHDAQTWFQSDADDLTFTLTHPIGLILRLKALAKLEQISQWLPGFLHSSFSQGAEEPVLLWTLEPNTHGESQEAARSHDEFKICPVLGWRHWRC